MPPTEEWVRRFEGETKDIRQAEVFKPGCAALKDHMNKGHGTLAEGINTLMPIGDLQCYGPVHECPEESSVDADYEHFYNGKETRRINELLPTLTLTGNEETPAGGWRLVYESQKSQLWAFLRFLAKMKVWGMLGQNSYEERLEKIMTDLLPRLPVLIIELQGEEELWKEWQRSNDVGHTDLQHSLERTSNRYKFFMRLKMALEKKLKDEGKPAEVQVKHLWAAYQEAEKKKKFQTAMGMTGVTRENELSSLMKWGDFMERISVMDWWKGLEVLSNGKTQFFNTRWASSFCRLADNQDEIVVYVLRSLTACIQEDEESNRSTISQSKLKDANPSTMSSIVRTLVLQWKWGKDLVEFCKGRQIMPAESQQKNFELIEECFSCTNREEFMADSTGKKANLHPLAMDLLEILCKTLWKQTYFTVFRGAEAMKQNIPHTLKQEALQNLSLEIIMNPWKDAEAQFAGIGKNMTKNEENEEGEEEPDKVPMKLPTREEAIREQAKSELENYMKTSFVRTGNTAEDRESMFSSALAAQLRTSENAQWNHENQGNTRLMAYDEAGRRNPGSKHVKGRNEYRLKVCFHKEDFNQYVEDWELMAKPGEGNNPPFY